MIDEYEAARASDCRPTFHRAHRALAQMLELYGAVARDGWRYAVDVVGDVWRTQVTWDSRSNLTPEQRAERVKAQRKEWEQRRPSRKNFGIETTTPRDLPRGASSRNQH